MHDLDSANGVSVNGAKIKKQRIANGDTIQIGYLEFKFLIPAETGGGEDDAPAVKRKSFTEMDTAPAEVPEVTRTFPWKMVGAFGVLLAAAIILVLLSYMN